MKYNNYANAGNDSGDGVNRIALLDPNVTQVDAHAYSNGMPVMREVLTVIGPTADPENRSASLPLAVREWRINTPGVNPAANSIFVPSEDGHLYRWNLVSNSLDQFLQLNAGIGEPYVPTIVGPDGTVFTLNGGTMSALGRLNGVGVALASSMPDVRTDVAGQSLTFSMAVTNTGSSGLTPTGTVTLTDTTYAVPSPGVLSTTTTTLASNLPLNANGQATFTTSALTADKHFITATYSGDATFSADSASLVQFVHASGTTTTLAGAPNPSNPGQPVTFTATVAAAPPGTGTPTGQVTFQDGNTVLAQVPVNSSGVASFSASGLAPGNHTVMATYASSPFSGSYLLLDEAVIRYQSTPPKDLVARLQRCLDEGKATLRYQKPQGYLLSVLRQLNVPLSSLMLVFSKTSFQQDRISPSTPRALYFNDSVYVGWVQGGDLVELAAVDPSQGTMFYTLEQRPTARSQFVRRQECLQCHASPKTVGVPGLLMRSVFTAADGHPQLLARSFVTDHSSPLKERWVEPPHVSVSMQFLDLLRSLRRLAETGAGLFLPPAVGCPDGKRQRWSLCNA